MNTVLLLSGALAVSTLVHVPQDCGSRAGGACPASKPKAALAAHPSETTSEKTIVATAAEAGQFGTLLAAAKAAGLVEALAGPGPLTVFAPTDAAFQKLPKGTVERWLEPANQGALARVLKYHVISGDVRAEAVVKLKSAATLSGQRVDLRVGTEGGEQGKVFVDRAQVVTADIACANGVIHVIDSVLLPSEKSLAEVAAGAGTFKTLVAAAGAAGLVETLSGDTELTILAPTDEAFAKLPAGTVESLLTPENKARLVAILQHHIVPGRVYSDQVARLGSAETLQGGTLRIDASESGIVIGGAKVTAADVEAANGVIHVIDTVLLPQ